MPKTIKKNNVIALELERFESKIKEFQDYLDYNNVNRIQEFAEDPSKRHQEIQCQIKIMDALPGWLAGLQKLRDSSDGEPVEMRGGAEPNGLMKSKL